MSRRNDEDSDLDFTDRDNDRRPDAPEASQPSQQKSGKRKRWPFVVLGFGAIIFFLPNAIGWMGWQQNAIDYALSDFNGKVTVERISLGWFSPIRMTNLIAVDANGNTLLQADEISSTKPLYAFLTSLTDLGQFEIQKPVAYVQLRPDGSNLEDSIANFIRAPASPAANPPVKPASESASPIPKVAIHVNEGRVVLSSTSSTQTWQLDGVNLIAQLHADEAPLVVDAQCSITPVQLDKNGQAAYLNSGGIALSSHVDAGQQQLNFNSADLILETENLPLSLAAPFLQRWFGPANTAGSMKGKVHAIYNGKNQSVALDVQHLDLDGFGIVAPEMIGSDQFLIDHISAQGVIQASPKLIAAQQFQVQSDVGKIKADGTLDVNQLNNLASGGKLLDTPFEMDGQIDLAKLIRMLPSTLQLHHDLVVNSGTVTFQAGSRNENGNRRMVVNLDTANINARRGPQNIDWAKPLRLVGTIQESKGKLSLEDVRCVSDFLTIQGSANQQTGSFIASGDLDKLMRRVGQFVDLQGTQLAGAFNGKFGWQVDPAKQAAAATGSAAVLPIQIGGSFDVTDPVIALPGMAKWQQPRISIKLTAAGQSHDIQKIQLDQGGVQLDIGQEKLIAQLASPIENVFASGPWTAHCQMTGGINRWLRHLQNFIDVGELTAAGKLNLTCKTIFDSEQLQFTGIKYQVDQLLVEGYGINIREPQATGFGSARYDLATGRVTIPETTISGSAISARGQQLEISYPSNLRIDGNVAFKADVNRVAGWFNLSPTPDSVFWYGGMDGTLQLASNENGIAGRVKTTVTDLIAAQQVDVPAAIPPAGSGQAIAASRVQRQWQEVWRESKLVFAGDLNLANDFNAIGLQSISLDSPSLKATANGSLADLAGVMNMDLAGTWNPSWDKINSLLNVYSSGLLKFSGSGEQQFVVRGPLFAPTSNSSKESPWVPESLQAAADFGWERGEILGLPVGESKMNMKLAQGIATIQSNGIPFAGGVVQFAPIIDMRGASPIATLSRTRILDNIVLQPETARQWLKYVAPLVADATSAQGNFTVDVEDASVPLLDPMKMQVKGNVKLNNVVIGAGPVAEQLLSSAKQLRTLLKPEATDRDLNTWIRMSEQTVPVVVQDERVYHDNIKLSHKDLIVQTRGSVGFDQTINLVAEIVIADDWIAGKSYLASLRGKTISVPVTGTISKPILDRRALQQLSQDLVKQAAGGYFNDQVNEQRNKLLDKYGDKLGLPPASGQNGQPQSIEKQLQDKAQDELIKGLGNLFGK